MNATVRLLEEGHAYADLSVDRIATEAGVSRSTFYVQFADRRALLLALADHAIAPVSERARGLATASPQPDEAAVRAGIAHVLDAARANSALLSAVIEAAGYDQEVRSYWRGANELLISLFASRFVEQQSAGRAREFSPDPMARVLVAMVVESSYRQLTGPSLVSDEELVEALATTWWRAVYG